MGHFEPTATADEVLDGLDLTGKRALVTGTSSGIGIETARALVARGAQVLGAVRDIAKAERATAEVRAAAQQGGGDFRLVQLDLASLSSVRACADHLVSAEEPLDYIIANAGVGVPPFGLTEDGFETQFGTNHLGHFVLVNRLAPLLKKGSRVVVLSSIAHRFADADFSDPNFERSPYDAMTAYARSKTANALFAMEFDRRHRAGNVRATSVNPGSVDTELERYMSPEERAAGKESMKAAFDEAGQTYLVKTPAQGAAPSVWAAVVAEADMVGGRYCEDCHVAEVKEGFALDGVTPQAQDPEIARTVWSMSEKMVGEHFPEISAGHDGRE